MAKLVNITYTYSKINLYEGFVNENAVENIDDEKNLEKILKSMCFVWLYSTFTIGFSVPLGALEIDVLNNIFFNFAFWNFVGTILFYVLFVKKTLRYKIPKRKIYAFIFPLPFIVLAFLIFALGTYDSVLIYIGRKDLIFILAGDIFIPLMMVYFLWVIFSCYAFFNCLSDYFLKRKPRVDKRFHR